MTKFVDPAITRVNRGFRKETTSVFYGANKFYLNTSKPGMWVKKITPYARFMTDVVKIGQCMYIMEGLRQFVDVMFRLGLGIVTVDGGFGGLSSKELAVLKSMALASSSDVAVPAVLMV
jgi:hypothetical protein